MTLSHPKAPAAALRWFREARFGMFIHYGRYSILGRHEWALCLERIPFAEYRSLSQSFLPVDDGRLYSSTHEPYRHRLEKSPTGGQG